MGRAGGGGRGGGRMIRILGGKLYSLFVLICPSTGLGWGLFGGMGAIAGVFDRFTTCTYAMARSTNVIRM